MNHRKTSRIGLLAKAVLLLTAAVLCLGTVTAGAAGEAQLRSRKSSIAAWSTVNSDIQGWLLVEGTNISYPVVFYPASTQYYNSLGYYKEYSRNGVIWADAQTKGGKRDGISQNTVLYGHNWTNVSAEPRVGDSGDVMFAQLPAYHHLDFAQEHQFIHYSTAEEDFVFQIFAVFYTEKSFVYNRSAPTAEQFDEIVSGARARSLHNYDVAVAAGDSIITLSTCTRAFGASSNQRFVVMGKLVEAGAQPVQVTAHENYQRPKL